MAATKASPATDEPVKRTATKSPVTPRQSGRRHKAANGVRPREARRQDGTRAKAHGRPSRTGEKPAPPRPRAPRRRPRRPRPPKSARQRRSGTRAEAGRRPDPGAPTSSTTDPELERATRRRTSTSTPRTSILDDLEDVEGARRRRPRPSNQAMPRTAKEPPDRRRPARLPPMKRTSPSPQTRTRPPATSSGTRRNPKRCVRPARTPSSPPRPTPFAPTSSRSARSHCSTPRKRSSWPSGSKPGLYATQLMTRADRAG